MDEAFAVGLSEEGVFGGVLSSQDYGVATKTGCRKLPDRAYFYASFG